MDIQARQNKTIREFKEGNQRFLAGTAVQSAQSSLAKLKNFAQSGQSPKAIVLCCSDSRAPVEMILDQDIGDLFVIRVAGNIVAPSLVGSVEFAVSTYGTNLILVMGHTQCGAIAATFEHIQSHKTHSSENIHDIVSRIKPHVFAISQIPDLPHEEKLRRASEANVWASVSQLSSSSRMIENLVFKKELRILGAVLELSSGTLNFLEI